MSIARIYSAQISGVEASIITIEADISNGLHHFSIVGLGDRSVEESKDRVAAAIKNSGYVSPKQKNQKVVISLAPADLRKEGPVFDVGIALAYLLAVEDIQFKSEGKMFLGELSLDGNLRPVHGILAMVQTAKKAGFTEIYLPKENSIEASLISDINIYAADSLKGIIDHFSGSAALSVVQHSAIHYDVVSNSSYGNLPDFTEIAGQENAKRALEIAATGRHNVVMYGPPGTGKSMLAKALMGILPPLTRDESIEVTSIHSIAKTLHGEIIIRPPFRSPHHTSSASALVGGGTSMKPGEITLAHHGILFLDEFAEFERQAIDALRQPLEERTIIVSRQRGSAEYPADFILIAAMNPCPCGQFHSQDRFKKCVCTDKEISRYQKKISGPIADRIDIWIPVLKVNPATFSKTNKVSFRQRKNHSSPEIRENIIKARQFKASKPESLLPISDEATAALVSYAKKLSLSGRGYHRTISVAETIASLDHSHEIKKSHILEALQYRQRDF